MCPGIKTLKKNAVPAVKCLPKRYWQRPTVLQEMGGGGRWVGVEAGACLKLQYIVTVMITAVRLVSVF